MSSVTETNLRDAVVEHLANICRPQSQYTSKKHKKGQDVKRQRPDEEGQKDVTSNASKIEHSVSEIKQMCKSYTGEAPKLICATLLRKHLLEGETSTERLKAIQLADTLFVRSANFRAAICDNLRYLLDAVFGPDVPGPNTTELYEKSADVLRGWTQGFGKAYPQLMIGLASVHIPLEQPQEVRDEDVIRANADDIVVEAIKRGFRIRDGAPFSGQGEAEASFLNSVDMKIQEVENGITLLLPFLGDVFSSSDAMDVLPGSEPKFGTVEDNGHSHDVEMFDGEDVDWEDEDEVQSHKETDGLDDDASNGFLLTSDVSVRLDDLATDDSLTDLRLALLDCRITCERSLLPTLNEWTSALERSLSRSARPDTVQTLVRVKNRVKDVQSAIERCSRLNIVPHPRSSKASYKGPSRSSSTRKKTAGLSTKPAV